MISVETAREMSREAAVKAAKDKQTPYYFWPEDESTDIAEQLHRLPMLGDYCPPGWERVDLENIGEYPSHGVYGGDNSDYGAYMVDSSGFGGKGERSLTFEELIERVKKHLDVAYAIVEAGEFQVKIGCFRKIR